MAVGNESMEKKYFVNEIFLSLQGEGYWTGTPMVFLRFSGCNLRCPFCDTDHTASTPYSLDALVAAVTAVASSPAAASAPAAALSSADSTAGGASAALSAAVLASASAASPVRRVCLTGGEPALQVDAALLDALHAAGFAVHIETNGTRPLPPGIDWVTLSPKSDFVEASPHSAAEPGSSVVVLTSADELKLVFTGTQSPATSSVALPAPAAICHGRPDRPSTSVGAAPDRWLAFPAKHHFLQPCYSSETGTSNVAETVAYILAHPSWRLSLQTHRILGLR